LTGTLPHLAQQNLFLGVPLLLNPEEVVLLVTKGQAHFHDCVPVTQRPTGLAVLVDDAPAHRTPTLTHLQAYNATQAESARHQIAQVEAKEAAEAGRAQSDAATRKRKEREGKRKRDAALRDQASGENFMVGAALMETFNPKGGIEPSRKDSESRMGNDREGSGTPSIVHSESKHAYSIVIPASSSSLEWYDPTEYVYTTIAAAKDAGIWTYPTSLHERAKCGVFKDLWAQGFYMGGGIKFGGDFLVYPGASCPFLPTSIADRLTGDAQ
jgi:tRNA-splicing endonuclease subunit Sen34